MEVNWNSQSHTEETSHKSTSSLVSKSIFHYGFIILFNWNEGVKKPFKIFPRNAFSTDDIRTYCYEKHLKNENRIRKLTTLKALPGHKMSLFCKVEQCEFPTNPVTTDPSYIFKKIKGKANNLNIYDTIHRLRTRTQKPSCGPSKLRVRKSFAKENVNFCYILRDGG